jgi:hypothetical protein
MCHGDALKQGLLDREKMGNQGNGLAKFSRRPLVFKEIYK